jgi:putative copper export protein
MLPAIARWIGYIGIMALTGAATFQAIVHFRVAPAYPEATNALLGRARAAGFLAALFLLIAACLKLLAQLQTMIEPGEALTRELLGLVVGSAWGYGWKLQAGIALLVLVLALVVRSTWTLVPLAVAAITAAPLTGHATEHPWGERIGLLLHGLHQLGGGVWIGTLLLVIAGGYGATRLMAEDERHRVIATLVHAYSPVALVGVGTATVIGLVLAYGYVHSISALWTTGYGRTLLLKTLFLAGTAGVGAYNWRRVRPSLGDAPTSARLYRSATIELVLGALLLGATAVLVALPAPAME